MLPTCFGACKGANEEFVDIAKDEELTYDYKFEREINSDDRIPCLCGKYHLYSVLGCNDTDAFNRFCGLQGLPQLIDLYAVDISGYRRGFG